MLNKACLAFSSSELPPRSNKEVCRSCFSWLVKQFSVWKAEREINDGVSPSFTASQQTDNLQELTDDRCFQVGVKW